MQLIMPKALTLILGQLKQQLDPTKFKVSIVKFKNWVPAISRIVNSISMLYPQKHEYIQE